GAGGAERRLLHRVLDVDAEVRAVAEVRADRLRQEGDGDHAVVEAVLAEQLEDVLHARLADDRDHRLRLGRRQRAEPRPPAPGHHDRLHANASRFALSTYSPSDTNASASPTQKMTSGQVAPSCVTIKKPSDAYRRHVAVLPRTLSWRSYARPIRIGVPAGATRSRAGISSASHGSRPAWTS